MKKKLRIDEYVYQEFNFGTLEDVRRIIMAGKVLNNNTPVYKSSEVIETAKANVRFKNIRPFVSRGGIKLKHALEVFDLSVKDRVVVDIGSSTGGFTDCALKNGASRVYAVDVGTNQLDYRLRTDTRVTVMEQTNFKSTELNDFPELPEVFTIDVSFTSIVPILRHIVDLFDHEYNIVALIKPQFESYLEEREADGIIHSLETHEAVITRVIDECTELGLGSLALDRSPIKGGKGNIEYLLHLNHGNPEMKSIDYKGIQPIVYG
ncbi:TlyA family RNA methyltransferase [Salinicoccus sp. HZC-1]|uniref:TlyA family RNA methyltransferase n=1 Tax=Salinicoccus sp. HZC-1 TaxID=3385497 RepID=UPI00398AA923